MTLIRVKDLICDITVESRLGSLYWVKATMDRVNHD
jgi:hypothetical protein